MTEDTKQPIEPQGVACYAEQYRDLSNDRLASALMSFSLAAHNKELDEEGAQRFLAAVMEAARRFMLRYIDKKGVPGCSDNL